MNMTFSLVGGHPVVKKGHHKKAGKDTYTDTDGGDEPEPISSGPEKRNIEKIAKGHDNIEIRGWVTEEEYTDLLSRCTATIYIPINEDSGISPVESMAAGKPCVVSNEGGVVETIVDGKTGVHIKATEEEVIRSVNLLDASIAAKMKTECQKRSKKFSEENFIREMKKQVRLK